MPGIKSFGAYVPRLRLQRDAVYQANRWFAPGLKGLAKGERAIANWDEDSVTMAVEAARDCLRDHSSAEVATVLLASTSLPFADRQNAGIVKEALNLSDAVGTLDCGGSQKAGTTMLIQAFHAAAAGPVLALASERRRARPASEDELVNGDAAAGLLLTAEDGIARLIGTHSVSVDFIDHFRPSGAEFDYGWESRWIREEGHGKLAHEAVAGVLEATEVAAGDISRFIAAIPGKGAAASLAKKAGIRAEAVVDDLSGVLGHAGTAQPLLLLAHALESAGPGEKLLVVGFGQGADAILLETTPAIADRRPSGGVSASLARSCPESNYMKYLAFAGHLQLELGKRAEFEQKPVLTALYRNRKAVMALVGGRCTRTGTVQFPRSEISVNQNDAAVGTQEDYPLADRPAKILTFTADNLTYTPDPPGYYGMIEFEGGGRMMAEFTDADPEAIEVGAPMRMMFRVKDRDQRSGFIKYFWKAVPAAGSN
ncbi:hydroxymethylglutaryl-CoA synthase family protein [Sphingobium indicum]|uniref:Hydroxymethylglutaryl-CoA synthase family protein n=1 Tax=Sphingobium indicum TaxID=332055 RepID=A0A4Q4J5N1_9SPHN|nr:OB-fold domain-containing protein [Sphingobium indicum]NYI23625.1 3-hydroxy-3-methylglutaryl CoA synthase [Sphingobium indicum]RYM01526.1 hydroxymethylglutaryl-CoA synthase family protein [Sphingobium indicum]